MTVTYYLTATGSDLTPGGGDFDNTLEETPPATDVLSVNAPANTTEDAHGFTLSGVPGTGGSTGDYQVNWVLTGANSNLRFTVQLHRVNSSGTIQSSSSTPSETSGAGTHTYNFTNLNLGTWAAGDRLRVDFRYRNVATMGGGAAGTVGIGSAGTNVVTPWTAAGNFDDSQTLSGSAAQTQSSELSAVASQTLGGAAAQTQSAGLSGVASQELSGSGLITFDAEVTGSGTTYEVSLALASSAAVDGSAAHVADVAMGLGVVSVLTPAASASFGVGFALDATASDAEAPVTSAQASEVLTAAAALAEQSAANLEALLALLSNAALASSAAVDGAPQTHEGALALGASAAFVGASKLSAGASMALAVTADVGGPTTWAGSQLLDVNALAAMAQSAAGNLHGPLVFAATSALVQAAAGDIMSALTLGSSSSITSIAELSGAPIEVSLTLTASAALSLDFWWFPWMPRAGGVYAPGVILRPISSFATLRIIHE